MKTRLIIYTAILVSVIACLVQIRKYNAVREEADILGKVSKAKSVARDDVQAAIDKLRTEGAVLIPPGVAIWTNGVIYRDGKRPRYMGKGAIFYRPPEPKTNEMKDGVFIDQQSLPEGGVFSVYTYGTGYQYWSVWKEAKIYIVNTVGKDTPEARDSFISASIAQFESWNPKTKESP